jgi:hypothetical protein
MPKVGGWIYIWWDDGWDDGWDGGWVRCKNGVLIDGAGRGTLGGHVRGVVRSRGRSGGAFLSKDNVCNSISATSAFCSIAAMIAWALS